MGYNINYLLKTRVMGNGFLEDTGNLCLAPVRGLFDGRTVYKIDKAYITHVPVANGQKRSRVVCVIVTALKIIVLIPLTPLIALGVALKIVALISSSTRKNHRDIIESYKKSSEKNNLMRDSNGWVRISGDKENSTRGFLASDHLRGMQLFSILSNFTKAPQEIDFRGCSEGFIGTFLSFPEGKDLLRKVKKIYITSDSTKESQFVLRRLFGAAPSLTEMHIEGSVREDLTFLKENKKYLEKIANIDWNQVKVDSIDSMVELVEAVPAINEANRLKLFASYWKGYLAKESDLTLKFPFSLTTPKEFYKVRNIELLVSQCKGLKKVDVPDSFTLAHIEAIQKNCPTLRKIYISSSNSSISDAEIDAFAKRNPMIGFTGKRRHIASGAGFDVSDCPLGVLMDIDSAREFFRENPHLTENNKRMVFAEILKLYRETIFDSRYDLDCMLFEPRRGGEIIGESDLKLFAQECKGIKRMLTINGMTPSQITTVLKNLPKPSTLEVLKLGYPSKNIEVANLEDFMIACPAIKEINILYCHVDKTSTALDDFCKKYPHVKIVGRSTPC